MKQLEIHISGKVQGVWFRKHTQEKANALGLVGEVKNMKNGDVHIEIRGDAQVLEAFIAWCHKGSPLSRVDQVKVTHSTRDNWPQDFRITY